MEIIYLSLLFLILGFIFAFISSILNNISIDDINQKNGLENNKCFSKIYFLSIESQSSLIIAEFTHYIISAIILGYFLFILYCWYYFAAGLIFFPATIFLFRYLATSVGIKFCDYKKLNSNTFIRFLFKISFPLIYFISLLEYKIKGQNAEEASREEISALVESAMEDGSLEEEEYRLLKNVMHFSEVLVSDVMTPRTVVFSCKADMTVGEILKLPEIQMYSRIPIWEGESLDDGIVGYITTKDIFISALNKKTDITLRDFTREISFIPENATLGDALEQFLKKLQHVFLVVDEYGGIDGIISMEDVMENILGVEIVDEADSVVDMRELAKQRRDKRINQKLGQIVLDEND